PSSLSGSSQPLSMISNAVGSSKTAPAASNSRTPGSAQAPTSIPASSSLASSTSTASAISSISSPTTDGVLTSAEGASSPKFSSGNSLSSNSLTSDPLKEADRAYAAHDWSTARDAYDRWMRFHGESEFKQAAQVLLRLAMCASNLNDRSQCVDYVKD